MKNSLGAVTETRRYRRLFSVFAVVLLVASLFGGVEALALQIEADDVEASLTLDAVLVEPRALKDDDDVRVARPQPAVERRLVTFSPIVTRPADSQVVSLQRHGVRQRASHPTGPPVVVA